MDVQKRLLKIGDTIEIDGHELVVTEMHSCMVIGHQKFTIIASDLTEAATVQAEQIKGQQLQQQILETLQKMFGNGGFSIGGSSGGFDHNG